MSLKYVFFINYVEVLHSCCLPDNYCGGGAFCPFDSRSCINEGSCCVKVSLAKLSQMAVQKTDPYPILEMFPPKVLETFSPRNYFSWSKD